MSTLSLFLWVQKAVAYLLDPAHRLIAIGVALFVLLTLGRFIVRSIKIIIFIVIIFSIFYFGLKYISTPLH